MLFITNLWTDCNKTKEIRPLSTLIASNKLRTDTQEEAQTERGEFQHTEPDSVLYKVSKDVQDITSHCFIL